MVMAALRFCWVNLFPFGIKDNCVSENHQLSRCASANCPGPVYKGHRDWQKAYPVPRQSCIYLLRAQASHHPAGKERLTTAQATYLPPLNQPAYPLEVVYRFEGLRA